VQTEIVLSQLRSDIAKRAAEDDVERGQLFASVATQLQALLEQVEPLRRELAARIEMQEKYDELNEMRFELLRGEVRRLDQQIQQLDSERERESWHETTGIRELEELSAKARQHRSMVPPSLVRPDEPRRRRPTPPPAQRQEELPPSSPPAASERDPKKSIVPPGTAAATVALARIVFADKSVVVRFVAVLTLLVVALTALLLTLRLVQPYLQ
jgi:hypothetical protein